MEPNVAPHSQNQEVFGRVGNDGQGTCYDGSLAEVWCSKAGRACLGLVSLAEFESEAADLRIDTEVAEIPAADGNPHRAPSPNRAAAK